MVLSDGGGHGSGGGYVQLCAGKDFSDYSVTG